MAPRTRTVRTAPTLPVNGEPAPVANEILDEGPEVVGVIPPPIDGLESLMAELAGAMQAKVTVYRINKSGPASYVYQCTPEAFNLDDLRDKYGGGEFRLYIVKDQQFFRNLKVNIEPTKAPPAAPSAPVDPHAGSIAALEAKFSAFQEFCMQNLGGGGSRQSMLGDIDLPATITAISAAIVALRPPPPPPAPPPPENNSADRAIDMLLKGIELAKELKGDGDGDSMMGVLRDLIKSPMLAQAVAATQAESQPGGSMAPPRLPQPQPQVLHAKLQEQPSAPVAPPAPPRPQLPQAGVPEFDAVGPVIARYLPLLVEKSKLESSSALYAELILDSVPAEAIDPILEHTSAEICEWLCLLYPPVRAEFPWFVSLIDEMRMMLEGEPEPPASGEGSGSESTGPAHQ